MILSFDENKVSFCLIQSAMGEQLVIADTQSLDDVEDNPFIDVVGRDEATRLIHSGVVVVADTSKVSLTAKNAAY
ncbi:hypothetical protein [Vibrio atypicus]|jgi:hypothetical protein|uniref:hypothetical protein n=1 Tax=Vibrio atypicus TaxID=558271 RepID=UPI00135B6CB6|nr:hypothetical protein [Vibrio atypicus]